LDSNESTGIITTRQDIPGCTNIDTCGTLEINLTPQHNGAKYKCEAVQESWALSKSTEVTLQVDK